MRINLDVSSQTHKSTKDTHEADEACNLNQQVKPLKNKLIEILDWAISDYQFDRHPIDHMIELPCFRNLKINKQGLLH